ncbi:Uncharacterised protein [Mycobacteroides abscessus subsp. abscessus]|uniref:hypothetical protein n=1 Tax=Mycobacteroides abscessus TaxID=36809 RepID=UPI0009C74D61|nr:hypothetical protein [Mycobacteroides abscessus]SKO34005.1 Uncharacterised protein [Mycobacteroides abscessus subsp. abscessus]
MSKYAETVVRQTIEHLRTFNPASARESLSTTYEAVAPFPEEAIREADDLESLLVARGWAFDGRGNMPGTASWNYPPSRWPDGDEQERWSITNISVDVLTEPRQDSYFEDGSVRLALVGSDPFVHQGWSIPVGSLVQHLGVIEGHKPDDPDPLPQYEDSAEFNPLTDR